MKKLILALLAAGTVATATAQEPHSILLYGDGSLSTIRDSGLNKTTSWDVNLGIGYQFNMNWTVGLKLMWGEDGIYKTAAGSKTTPNEYSVGPFVRYSKYFGKSEIFFWYGQVDVDYMGGYTTMDGNPATDKGTGLYAGFYPAIGINIHHGLALNFNVGGINYSTIKYKDEVNSSGMSYDQSNSTNTFNVTFGHQLNVGISKNFGCHHKMHHSGEPGDEMHSRKAGQMDDDDAAPKPKKKDRSRDDDE